MGQWRMIHEALESTSQAWVTAFLYAYLTLLRSIKAEFFTIVLALKKSTIKYFEDPHAHAPIPNLHTIRWLELTSILSIFVLLCRRILRNLGSLPL